MLGRLFSKLFGRKRAAPSRAGSRPVSPPPPMVPLATPPPPPPVQGYGSPSAPARPVPEAAVREAEISARSAEARPSPPEPTEPLGAGGPDPDPLDVSQPLPAESHDAPQSSDEEPLMTTEEAGSSGGVRLILEDGTLAKPSLDPELEERLRYIVDNIVPPSDQPSP